MAPYQNQHLISRVVLKNFCDDRPGFPKLLRALRRAAPEIVVDVPIRTAAQEDWFIGEEPERFEIAWSTAESAMPTAYAELASHTSLDSISTQTAGRIRNLMALHLVRSFAAVPLWDLAGERIEPRRRAAVRGDGEIIRLHRESGAHPPEWSDDQILDKIIDGFGEDTLRPHGLAFGETLLELYEKVQKTLGTLQLEIVEATEGEFILPDIPCLPVHPDGRVGLLSGAGIRHAESIMMPLAPRILALLNRKTQPTCWPMLRLGEVAAINTALAGAVASTAFFRPGSDLEEQVRSVWQQA